MVELCSYCGRPLPHKIIWNKAGHYVTCNVIEADVFYNGKNVKDLVKEK